MGHVAMLYGSDSFFSMISLICSNAHAWVQGAVQQSSQRKFAPAGFGLAVPFPSDTRPASLAACRQGTLVLHISASECKSG